MATDTTEKNNNWLIVLLIIVASFLISIITSAMVVKDKHNEFSSYYNERLESMQAQLDSLCTVVRENKELPAFNIVLYEGKQVKKDTIIKPIPKTK